MQNAHLDSLNKDQRVAAEHKEGAILVLAGAGAGKTRTLTHRILHLIHQGVEPRKILAITFTNKASKEMKERVHELIEKSELVLADKSQLPYVSTFHALGVQILRENAELLGLTRYFTIFDRADSISLIKKVMKEVGEDPKQFEPRTIISVISKEKGKMVTAEEFSATAEGNGSYTSEVIAKVWKKYDIEKKKEKALDFDDLLLETALLLKNNKEIRQRYQDRWHYIHIDEYQDTNEVQYQIATMICGDKCNLCAVGDIDQNIYSWRGATIKNILGFEKDFPNATCVLLEQNYRSTGNILEAANTIIKKNTNRREKNLFTENESGSIISVYNAFDEGDEARFISEEANQLIRDGIDPSEIAVLYRANFQSRVLEEKFLRSNVPYQVLGTRFFDRREVKDILSFIKAALNPDDITSISRVINIPPRGIGKVTLLKVLEKREEELSGKAQENVKNFRNMLFEISIALKEQTPSDAIKYIIKRTGLEEKLKHGNEDDVERLENIRELATLAKKYDELVKPEGIERLLEDAALATDQDELEKNNGGVKLMTVHASKGLEFDHVFIAGLEEGLFPHERLSDKGADTEEERRLFYVALTRARKKVYLTYAGIRTIFGSQTVNTPSTFIGDIDEHLIEFVENIQDDVSSQAKNIFIDW